MTLLFVRPLNSRHGGGETYAEIVVVVVVVILTLTHRYDVVRGHRTGSNDSGAEGYLSERHWP